MATKKTSPGAPTLFEQRGDASDPMGVPLAERMRPRTLEELVGQRAILGDAAPLARAIREDRVRSMIFWGPPGSGKTTLARVIAEATRAKFVPLNAVLARAEDVRAVVAEAKEAKSFQGRRTILFIDEIHRFNKAQQDAFLPHVEAGVVTLVGATTENPSFAVNAPLLSRCKVLRLRALDAEDIERVLARAVESPRGLGGRVRLEPEAARAIARLAQGDARRALTSLEIAADEVTSRGGDTIGVDEIAAEAEHKTLLYDKAGEEHFNVISAFIKSMRGSDPDASIYWFMRMIESGDDPLFLLRRMIIFASEDVGNADPRALEIALAADAAYRRVGMPEGLFPLAQAVLYLATAPKSNAAMVAWQSAQAAVHEHGALEVPLHLRNAATKLMKDEGYGDGYRYPHDEEGGVARGASYLPDAIHGESFYRPTSRGYEKTIAERLAALRAKG
ncbi:MAG: replication-associated recombination protein A [Polyangiaceae bacterium]